MDTCTLYITNHLQLINEETGNGTTYSGTLKENNTSFHRASDPCIKITLQQRKQEMQTLPQKKLIIICRPELSSINVINSCPHAATEAKRYYVTIQQSLPPRLLCKFVKYINDGYEYS